MASLLSILRAQDAALETIRRALRTGRVHHAYLFEGPDGGGKELAEELEKTGYAGLGIEEGTAAPAPTAVGH